MKTQGKRKKVMLWAMVLALTLLVLPSRKAEAATTQIVWGTTYSGELCNGDDETAEYSFTMSKSGTFSAAFTISNIDDDFWRVKMSDIEILDVYGKEICSTSIEEGSGTFTAALMAGNYTLRLNPGYSCACKYSFTATMKASGETKSENYLSMNDEQGMATTYKAGKSYTGYLAFGEEQDVYKVKITKNKYMKFTINSKVRMVGISIKNTLGDVSYSEREVAAGKHSYTYFLPKGTYYITVSRFNNYNNSKDLNYAGTYTFKTTLSSIPKTTLGKCKNVSDRKLTVKWSRNDQINGYQVQIATDKKFKKGKKTYETSDKSIGSYTFTGLKKGKTYYIRVRTVAKAGNATECVSGWSKVKTVKIKM